MKMASSSNNGKKRRADNGASNASSKFTHDQPFGLAPEKRLRFETTGSARDVTGEDWSVGDIALDISVAKFAACRAAELETLSKAIEIGGTKLSFQRLPRHMRRRAMSHDIRRIPRRLRLKAQAELEKREKKGVNKKPSRRHRRRPSNLLSKYQQRQRKNAWLETHIWHAKRFKMTTVWGYRLPVHPSDKSLRACYRATTHHCLLQDVSYECCIQVRGCAETILEALSHVTSKDAGLTFAAKTTLGGQRWGKVMVYGYDTYPYGAVAPVTFLWKPENQSHEQSKQKDKGENSSKEERTLWVWVHPSAYSALWTLLKQVCLDEKVCDDSATANQKSELTKRQLNAGEDDDSTKLDGDTKLQSDVAAVGDGCLPSTIQGGGLQIVSLKDQLVKLRLTGPASNRILEETLQPASVLSTSNNTAPQDSGDRKESSDRKILHGKSKTAEDPPCSLWWQGFYSEEDNVSGVLSQQKVFGQIGKTQSPDEVPPHAVLAMTVRDPRVVRPTVRTKVDVYNRESSSDVLTWENMPASVTSSPLWDDEVRNEVTKTKMSEQEMNKCRSQMLVPGSALNLGDKESRVPILLLQRPGSTGSSNASPRSSTARAGVGSGWDIVAPKGWGMALWIALVYRGCRVGGLREARSLSTRSTSFHFPHDFVDTGAGRSQGLASQEELVEKHVRRPPAKRVNYARLGVVAPFHTPFQQLVSEWQCKAGDILGDVCVGDAKGEKSAKPVTSQDETSIADTKADKLAKPVPSKSQDETSIVGSEKNFQGLGGLGAKAGGRDSEGTSTSTPESNPQAYVLRCRKLLRALQEASQATHSRNRSKTNQKSAHVKQKPGDECDQRKLTTFLERHRALVSENQRSLVPVSLSCLQRGVPAPRTMICLPSEEDLKQLAKDSTFGGPVERLHPKCKRKDASALAKTELKAGNNSSIIVGQTSDKSSSQSQKDCKIQEKKNAKNVSRGKDSKKTSTTNADSSDPKRPRKGSLNAKQLAEKAEAMQEPQVIQGTSDRPVVGFLTDGDFDLGQGHGSGLGFCSLVGFMAALERTDANRPLLVLVRNPTSRQYRFANVSVIL